MNGKYSGGKATIWSILERETILGVTFLEGWVVGSKQFFMTWSFARARISLGLILAISKYVSKNEAIITQGNPIYQLIDSDSESIRIMHDVY